VCGEREREVVITNALHCIALIAGRRGGEDWECVSSGYPCVWRRTEGRKPGRGGGRDGNGRGGPEEEEEDKKKKKIPP
jgi:hypothetical protein